MCVEDRDSFLPQVLFREIDHVCSYFSLAMPKLDGGERTLFRSTAEPYAPDWQRVETVGESFPNDRGCLTPHKLKIHG